MKSSTETLSQIAAFGKSMLEAAKAGDKAKASALVRRASARLNGVPLRSLGPITTFIGSNVFKLVGKQRAQEAWMLLQAGLALLPEEATLLAALGEIQLCAGRRGEARASLERALARQAGLDDVWKRAVLDLLAT